MSRADPRHDSDAGAGIGRGLLAIMAIGSGIAVANLYYIQPLLAEIGRKHEVSVSDEELMQAMRAEAMKYGPQAQQVFDLFRQNPNAQAQLRAPIFEDKVVDLIVERAKVKDTKVSKDELMKDDELPEGYGAWETVFAELRRARRRVRNRSHRVAPRTGRRGRRHRCHRGERRGRSR